MELLRELLHLQHDRGWLSDEMLRELAERRNVPLYRLEGLVSFYTHFRRTPPPRVAVNVCRDLGCWMAGSRRLAADLRREFAAQTDVEIHEVSCLGRCDSAPAAAVNDEPLAPVTLANQDEVRNAIANPGQLVHPSHVTSQRFWKCDPYRDLQEHYGTVRALVATQADIRTVCTSSLKQANLRGMGGAGFPTGKKWELVAGERSQPKYVICNADESEPGTFKDRAILEQLPHLVIEGMLLAGLSIGAEQGIVFLRHEYAREQFALESAIQDARSREILGANAAGSGRRFDIEVFVSPGGYILGEETALLEALEDKRGEPRNKPPYPGTHGLWGQPTLINNVETLAFTTTIVARGPEWWHKQGTNGCSGLKFISVSGDVANRGVYEVPLGTTIRDLIALAGGRRDGKPLAAILPGGASSNFLPASKLDTPLDFEALKATGSMLGSGAVVAIAEGTDLFALAANITAFFRNESCGKCVPCRVGSHKAVELLERVQSGNAAATALAILPELGETMTQTSICGLGQVALGPVLSLLKEFPNACPK